MLIPLGDNAVAVESAADLKTAVSVNDNITRIHFAKDIVLTDGITIHPDRLLLILDGEYPVGSGNIHSFTDIRSTDAGQTLGIRAASKLQLTLRNMQIKGDNFYGVPYVIDSNTTAGVTVTYKGVEYTGRQMIYNRHGLSRYIDCDITITDTVTGVGEEVGEVSRVELGGKTVIRKLNNANSAFWFCGDTGTNSLTILSGADVSLSTANYLMFLRRTADAVPITIEPGAVLRLQTNSGISYNNDHRAASFYVGENALFEYNQMSAGIGASLAMTGTLTVRPGARFLMRADYSGGSPMIRFRTSGAARNLNLDNPKSFVVYKNGSAALSFDSSRPFFLSGQQVNYWQNAGDGSFEDPPLYPWHNPDWSDFEITGNAGASTSVATSTLTTPISPALSNLQLQNARVLSVGNLPLSIHKVVDNHRPITGLSDPYANIRVNYTAEDVSYTLSDTADEKGGYSVDTPAPLPLNTGINVSANVPFLYRTAVAVVIPAGILHIEYAPESIRFVVPCVSYDPLILLGRGDDEPIVVFDDRAYESKWELLATIDGPMHTGDGLELPGEVSFAQADTYSDLIPLKKDVLVRVYTGGPSVIRTRIVWSRAAGILLHLTGGIRLGREYIANLTWSVRPIEDEE